MTYDSHDEYILLFPAPDICQSKNVFCNQPHGSCLAQPQTNQTECVCHVGYKNSPQCLPGNFFTMIVDLKSWFLQQATEKCENEQFSKRDTIFFLISIVIQ